MRISKGRVFLYSLDSEWREKVNIRIKNQKEKIYSYLYRSPGLSAFIINALFVVFILLFCSVEFESNDDAAMSGILYGVNTGYYSAHLVFVNCWIGLLLKALMSVVPVIPWYSVLMYIILFLSYYAVSYCLIKKDNFWGTCVSLVFLLFYGYHTYVTLQFTEVAAVSTIAGIVLLFTALEEKKISKWQAMLAFLLLLFGAGYRFSMFASAFIIMSGYGVYQLVKHYKDKSNFLRWFFRCMIMFGVSIIICFGLEAADRYEYNNNDLYKEYVKFNSYRAILMDYGFPDYDEYEDVYQRLNISEEDMQFFKSWNFADPDVFTTDVVVTLGKIKADDRPEINGEFVDEFFSWFPVQLLKYNWLPGFLLICIFALLCSNNKFSYLYIVYEILVLGAIQFYLFYKGRYLISRVDIGLFFAASVVIGTIMLDMGPKYRIDKRMALSVASIVLLTLCPVWYKENKQDETEIKEQQRAWEVTRLLNEDKEKLYLCSVGSVQGAYGVWDVISPGRQSNSCSLGGWRTYSPTSIEVLREYGVDNPFRDMVDNPDIYLADKEYADMITAYISRHYNENVYACSVKNIKGVFFYKLLSKEVCLDTSDCAELPERLNVSFQAEREEEMISVDGYVYIDGQSSYQGETYAVLEDSEGNQTCCPMRQYENPDYKEDLHGQYSGYWTPESIESPLSCKIKIYYKNGDSLYCVWEEEIDEAQDIRGDKYD